MSVSRAEERRASARLYALLGHLLLDGWTEDALVTARALPAIADALPDLSTDELAARHHAAFGRGVRPHVSVIVGDDGQLGGERARRAADLLRRCGLTRPRQDVEPDHAGQLLRAAGFLLIAEGEALEDGRATATAALVPLQTELLDEHLLLLWPPLELAVRGLGLSEWTAVIELAGALLLAHRSRLPEGDSPSVAAPPSVDLSDPKTGIARIARWMMVCGQSGVWWTHGDLAEVASRADVPRGFGSRSQVLESLLLAAVDQGRIALALDALLERIERWQQDLRVLGERGLPVSAWLARSAQSREVLLTMRSALSNS